MSFWQEIKANRAAGASPRLGEFIRTSVGYGSGMPVSDPDPALYAAQAELMQRLSWVYSAVTAVAESTASLAELEVFERSEEDETALVNHEFEQLLRKPNEYQFDSQFEFFEAIAGFLKLSGNCYIFLNALSETLPPAELYLLRPDRVQVVPDKDKFVRGYIFTVDGAPIMFEPWEIVHIKRFHPLNDWYGLSAIESLALASESDFKMAEWNRNFFAKDNAKPQGALAYAEFIEDSQWDKMKRETKEEHGGTTRRMMMLRGAGKGGVEYLQMGLSQKDMEFFSGRQFTKEEIWMTLAPGLLQIMDKNVTEANSTAGEKTLREYVIYPMLTRIAQKFTARILPRYGENLVGRFKDIRYRDRAMELSERNAYERVHTVAEVRRKYDGDEGVGDERDNLFPDQVAASSLQARDFGAGLNARGDLTAGAENPEGDAAKAQDAHTGAMIAFAIPEAVGTKLLDAVADGLPKGAEALPLDELHITLAYLGDTATNALSRDAVAAALKIFTARHPILRGKINGVGKFGNSEGDGRTAFYASFDSPDLPDFRRDLVKTLEAAGAPVSDEHGFTPHITLAYIADDATEIPANVPALPIAFTDVALVWGDEWESFRLAGESDNALKSDLSKWEAKAVKRLKEHGSAACDFTSDDISPTLNAAIAGALETAPDALAVKAIFASAIEWKNYP